MTIGYYGRAMANRAGIGRYSRQLLEALIAERESREIRVFAGSAVNVPPGCETIVLGGGNNRILEEQRDLPAALRRRPVDVFHNPDFTLPITMPRTPCIVTVHDVAYVRLPNSNSVKSKLLLNAFVPRAVRRADAIIAVSEFTKRETVDVYGVDPAKIHVIPNAVDPRFHRPSEERIEAFRAEQGLPSEGLVMYLGAIEERKNLVRLAEAVAKIPGATLAVGGSKNRNAEEILGRMRQALGDRFRLLGYVADEDLPTLYASATVFAYPSVYEGFGLQLLEAMACGTPLALSSAPPFPEVAADAAEYYDPLDVTAMADTLRRVVDFPSRQRELTELGFDRCRRFTWPDVARQTLALYDQVASQR